MDAIMNAIVAATHAHTFIYRGWEVESQGNPLAHAILRGYVDKYGKSFSNYHYEDLLQLLDLYGQTFESSRRAIHVTKGTVNLMDSVGGGRVIGHTGTNNPDAGASAVKAGSVMNMYGGTIKDGTGFYRGGNVVVKGGGTLNIEFYDPEELFSLTHKLEKLWE